MKNATIFIVIIAVLLMASCTAQPNTLASPDGDSAGFFMGIWHGLIAPFSFIISLFSDKVGIYEVYNTGNWYNLGFLFGLSVIFGGSGKASCRKC